MGYIFSQISEAILFLKWRESEETCDEPTVEEYQVAWLSVIANRNFAT
jgi:hypothetical protein